MTPAGQFKCRICDEASKKICKRCTHDTCDNHLCAKCSRCCDCCLCEQVLDRSPSPQRTN